MLRPQEATLFLALEGHLLSPRPRLSELLSLAYPANPPTLTVDSAVLVTLWAMGFSCIMSSYSFTLHEILMSSYLL